MKCLNCDTHYVGRYCPHCGQSASTQRFTVRNVMMSTLEVWGMGNRSLPRTLWHLFTRPGKMIGDYLDGKRIAFFPPVKMLFVLCVFFAVADFFLDGKSIVETVGKPAMEEIARETAEKPFAVGETDEPLFRISGHAYTVSEVISTAKGVVDWLEKNKAVKLILLHCLFMFYTKIVFRHAPARPGTNLAENFFIQVFISSQMVALSILYLPFLSSSSKDFLFYPLPDYILLALFVWDFKQLFGYSWKTTLKRTIIVHLLVCFTVVAFMTAIALLIYSCSQYA